MRPEASAQGREAVRFTAVACCQFLSAGGTKPVRMTYAYNLWLFAILVFGIIIVPGMDMFFVIANALTGGRARGMMATAGVMTGGVFHTVFAALFVGAMTAFPDFVFTVILLAGAAYMAWIGWTLVRSSITVDKLGSDGAASTSRAFMQGFITCVLNPKAYMFTLAVYPSFMLPKWGPVWSQAVAMGAITVAAQAIIYGGLGLAAAKSRDFLVGSPGVTIWIGRLAGALFLVVAIWTVWSTVA
jgi:threonine/homoserine/homoserine lactone efflux protein